MNKWEKWRATCGSTGWWYWADNFGNRKSVECTPQGWIKTSEFQCPDVGLPVIIAVDGERLSAFSREGGLFSHETSCRWDNDNFRAEYWQPMPELPEGS